MRPFVFFFTFFSFFSAAALVSARTETIDNYDTRIDYNGKWKTGSFQGNPPVTYNNKGHGSATLMVSNASGIAVAVAVERPGDTVLISLDYEGHVLSNISSRNLAWSSNLDPNVSHIITVTKQNPEGSWTSIHSFLVTYPDSLENTTNTVLPVSGETTSSADEAGASSTPNSSESPPPQSNTEPILSGAKLAGVIVGCITVPAIIFGIILYRRRMVKKRKAASTAYWEFLAARARQPPGPQFPPAPSDEGFDGVQAKEMP